MSIFNHALSQITGTVETALGASYYPVRRSFRKNEEEMIIESGKDETVANSEHPVRLRGYYNRHPNPKGLVLVLHGWEGSSHSVDTIDMASGIHRRGYETFRLNFRDHGKTHELNEGVFSGALIGEVSRAGSKIASLRSDLPFYIVGSSLGGNFALRMNCKFSELDAPNLKKVVALCPAVQPHEALKKIDRNPFIKQFFRTKWLASLARKQKIFPEKYDFRSLRKGKSIAQMVERFDLIHLQFGNSANYFDLYTLNREKLSQQRVASVIIGAVNDPVIPIEGIRNLHSLPNITLDIRSWGGHTAFVRPLPFRRLASDMVVDHMEGRGDRLKSGERLLLRGRRNQFVAANSV